jgi:thiol-disulfide isomerase/thioredoxin
LGCHLCEYVPPLLDALKQEYALDIHFIDIADDDQLIERYGQEIPVLYRPDIDMDMVWPFDGEHLRQFLSMSH